MWMSSYQSSDFNIMVRVPKITELWKEYTFFLFQNHPAESKKLMIVFLGIRAKTTANWKDEKYH